MGQGRTRRESGSLAWGAYINRERRKEWCRRTNAASEASQRQRKANEEAEGAAFQELVTFMKARRDADLAERRAERAERKEDLAERQAERREDLAARREDLEERRAERREEFKPVKVDVAAHLSTASTNVIPAQGRVDSLPEGYPPLVCAGAKRALSIREKELEALMPQHAPSELLFSVIRALHIFKGLV